MAKLWDGIGIHGDFMVIQWESNRFQDLDDDDHGDAYVKLTTYGKMMNQERHESLGHLPKFGKWSCPKMMKFRLKDTGGMKASLLVSLVEQKRI